MDKIASLNNNNKSFQFYFFIAIFLTVLTVVFFVFKPFLYVFLAAVIFSVMFSPLHQRILKLFNKRKVLSAFITVVILFILILIPLTFLGIKISLEAGQLYSSLSADGSPLLLDLINFSHYSIDRVLNYFNLQVSSNTFVPDFNTYLKEGISWLLMNLKTIFSSLSLLLFNGIILLIMLYYLFLHSDYIKDMINKLSPLPSSEDESIIENIKISIHSVLRRSLIIAVVQGALVGVGFLIFGIPQAALWGSVAVITALVPSVGTTIILIPAILYLWFTNQTLPAIGLLIWGILIVGLIDNVLALFLMKNKANVHPFLVFLSVLGGIALWGPLGFILGPVTLSLFAALFNIYFCKINTIKS